MFIPRFAKLLVAFVGLLNFACVPLVSFSTETNYTGVFIADTEGYWFKREDNSARMFGYVICDGGYLGSPLISNSKETVDKYLDKCPSGKREHRGLLPIIEDNSQSKTLYPAYKFELNGREYNLCKGYLTSSKNCTVNSFNKAEAKLAQTLSKHSGIKAKNLQAEKQVIRSSEPQEIKETSSLNSPQQKPILRTENETSNSEAFNSDIFNQKLFDETLSVDSTNRLDNSLSSSSYSSQQLSTINHSIKESAANALTERCFEESQLEGCFTERQLSQKPVSKEYEELVATQNEQLEQPHIKEMPVEQVATVENIAEDFRTQTSQLPNTKPLQARRIDKAELQQLEGKGQLLKLSPAEYQALKEGKVSLHQLLEAQAPTSGKAVMPERNLRRQNIETQQIQIKQVHTIAPDALINNNPEVARIVEQLQSEELNNTSASSAQLNVIPLNKIQYQKQALKPQNNKKVLQLTAAELQALKAGQLDVKALINQRGLQDYEQTMALMRQQEEEAHQRKMATYDALDYLYSRPVKPSLDAKQDEFLSYSNIIEQEESKKVKVVENPKKVISKSTSNKILVTSQPRGISGHDFNSSQNTNSLIREQSLPQGPPITQATYTIYGTHSNTQYWPGQYSVWRN
ncbi:MAG TPA: hypothetical protein V6C96_02285 [Vampirovibrionales bacterium]